MQQHRLFFWSPLTLRAYSSVRGFVTFDDLAAHRNEIGMAELVLRKQFSDSLIEQLLEEERKAQYEPFHRHAIVKMCHFIGAHISTKRLLPTLDTRILPMLQQPTS